MKSRKFWQQGIKECLLAVLFLFLGVMEAGADIYLTRNFSVTGFLRHEFAVHTAGQNPNNKVYHKDNNWLNLSRSFFQTEWTFRPNDTFKLYSKIRVMWDQTNGLDSNLKDYDAFPLATPRYGTYLRATESDEDVCLEMSELYIDIDMGKLWVRLGKQPIAWGEMIGTRILDKVNPLDLSWHFQFEPEEFENIRIPEWSIRAVYNLPPLFWFKDAYIEGFLNPGDVSPNINPEPGSPYRLSPNPSPIFVTTEKDRRGYAEYGFRVGARLGQVFGTLNYMHLYADSGYWQYVSGGPAPPFFVDIKYPGLDVYGISLNYEFNEPIRMTVTFEGVYIPNQPYYDARSALPNIKKIGEYQWAVRLTRKTFVFPKSQAMDLQLQFSQTVVDGDPDSVKLTPGPLDKDTNKVDKTKNILAFLASQYFWSNQIKFSLKVLYDLDDCHFIYPGFRYAPGDHWIFDIYGVILGGSEKRAGRFGALDWADEVFARITYQF